MKWNHESTFCRGCDCCEPFVYDSILFEIAHKAILVGNDEPLNDGSVSIGQSHNNDSTNKSGQPVDDHTCRRLPVIWHLPIPSTSRSFTFDPLRDLGHCSRYGCGSHFTTDRSEPPSLAQPEARSWVLHPRGNAFRYPSHRRIWELSSQL